VLGKLVDPPPIFANVGFLEEFAIYMNYVRKLGFEETPDYDFLRELFSKVLKTLGEPEDGIFDWMLLNGGKGWEASNVSRPSLFSNILLTRNGYRLQQIYLRKPTPMPARLIPHTAKGGTARRTDVHHGRHQMVHHQHRTCLALLPHTSRAVVDGPAHKIAQHHGAILVCNLWLPLAAG